MEKIYKVGSTTMSKEAYDNFVSLDKQGQIEYLNSVMSPKNEELAIEALKNVPNGGNNISKGSVKPTTGDNTTADTGTSEGSGNARSKADTGKSK